jgi:hypothetical protein
VIPADVADQLREKRGWHLSADSDLAWCDDRIVFPTGTAYDPFGTLPGPKMKALAGAKRALYPDPAMVPPNGSIIVICEGEPDAVAARSADLDAYGVPGAPNWQHDWAESFRGAHVAVIFDCDEAGRNGAQKVAASLSGIAASVKIIDLDEDSHDGYDLTKFLVEHGSPDDPIVAGEMVRRRFNETPVYDPNPVPDSARLEARSLHGRVPQRVEFLYTDVPLPIGQLALLAGREGTGKSTWTARLAARLTRDEHRVLMLADEDACDAVLLPRLLAAGIARKGWGWHCLRHYVASKLIERGEPVTRVAQWLGHENPGITLTIYAHVVPGGAPMKPLAAPTMAAHAVASRHA